MSTTPNSTLELIQNGAKQDGIEKEARSNLDPKPLDENASKNEVDSMEEDDSMDQELEQNPMELVA